MFSKNKFTFKNKSMSKIKVKAVANAEGKKYAYKKAVKVV